jgi:hypothetical protein
MEGSMAYSSGRLPTRFPVGTKFVIEGRPGDEGQMQVFSRFIEFPDGTRLKLPKRPAPQKSAPAGRRARLKRARKH